jgi:signal transduction histidine kinase
MRALIFELRPAALAEEGLVAALRKHAEAVGMRHRVDVDVSGPDERLPLARGAEEHVFRLAQEALANAAKHAQASRIDVSVRRDDGHVELRVRDDGRGFDPRARYDGHLGLETMRSRAAELGGRLVLESAPGQGTDVTLTVPLADG